MRIVIDALAATRYSGGMFLHAKEIITTWAEEHSEDHLTVVCGRALRESFPQGLGLHFATWPNESILGRAPGQMLFTPLIALLKRADRVISLSPIVSPLIPRNRSVCFQHDWRHIRRPEEFSGAQKAYRLLWKLSAATAGMNVCISRKAEVETLEVTPRARTTVIENGRDHARRWNSTSQVGVGGAPIVTFGHHNNKRPELVIEAFSQLPEEMRKTHPLTVLGARGEYQKSLERLAEKLGAAENVELPGFVEDEDYHRLISSAATIALMSSDEGFGLPLAEAEYFGITGIVSSDSDVSSLFPTALVAEPTPESLRDKLIEILSTDRHGSVNARVAWGWSDTVRSLRALR